MSLLIVCHIIKSWSQTKNPIKSIKNGGSILFRGKGVIFVHSCSMDIPSHKPFLKLIPLSPWRTSPCPPPSSLHPLPAHTRDEGRTWVKCGEEGESKKETLQREPTSLPRRHDIYPIMLSRHGGSQTHSCPTSHPGNRWFSACRRVA